MRKNFCLKKKIGRCKKEDRIQQKKKFNFLKFLKKKSKFIEKKTEKN